MTDRTLSVLQYLSTGQKFGADFVNARVLSPLSVYVHLAELEAQGLIAGAPEELRPGEVRPPRRTYSITHRGITALAEHGARQ